MRDRLSQPIPLPIGLSYRGDRENGYPLRQPAFPVGASRTLSDFTENFVFFTPGILVVWGGFDGGPLADFVVELGHIPEIQELLFDRQLFVGLKLLDEDPFWNHVLWATPKAQWPRLRDYLVSLVFIDNARKRLVGIGLQDLKMSDPLLLDKQIVLPPELPLIPIYAFGINASDRVMAFEPAVAVGLTRPAVKRLPPSEAVRVRAAGLYGDQPKLETQ